MRERPAMQGVETLDALTTVAPELYFAVGTTTFKTPKTSSIDL